MGGVAAKGGVRDERKAGDFHAGAVIGNIVGELRAPNRGGDVLTNPDADAIKPNIPAYCCVNNIERASRDIDTPTIMRTIADNVGAGNGERPAVAVNSTTTGRVSGLIWISCLIIEKDAVGDRERPVIRNRPTIERI